jgi:hypothetical protein
MAGLRKPPKTSVLLRAVISTQDLINGRIAPTEK